MGDSGSSGWRVPAVKSRGQPLLHAAMALVEALGNGQDYRFVPPQISARLGRAWRPCPFTSGGLLFPLKACVLADMADSGSGTREPADGKMPLWYFRCPCSASLFPPAAF